MLSIRVAIFARQVYCRGVCADSHMLIYSCPPHPAQLSLTCQNIWHTTRVTCQHHLLPFLSCLSCSNIICFTPYPACVVPSLSCHIQEHLCIISRLNSVGSQHHLRHPGGVHPRNCTRAGINGTDKYNRSTNQPINRNEGKPLVFQSFEVSHVRITILKT